MNRPPEQLDIFADSPAVALRNDVLAALWRRDAALARRACQGMEDAFPEDPNLAGLRMLVDALADASDVPIVDPHELARHRTALAGPLSAAARRAFGAADGQAWLRPAWRALATRCAPLPFDAAHPDEHAAPLWLHAEDGALAAEATARIESWRRIPAPLGWMLQARARIDGLDAAWPLLCELAWLAPKRLAAVLEHLRDPLLIRLRKKFEAAFDGSGETNDLAWFPAWLLVETPALAPRLAPAQVSNHTPAEQAMRLMLDLLTLERDGRHHDLARRRQRLRHLNESLYGIYLSTR